MNFTEFLQENVYIVSVVLFIIGIFLKQTPKVKNWAIPYILSLLGIIACNLILGFSINSTLQGILTTGVAVYAYQLYKEGKICINCSKEK